MTGGERYREWDTEVAGGRLHVGEWAGGSGSALLIHGVTASHRAWPWLAEELSDMRLIAPDLRGRGRSNDVVGHAGMAAHADDLARVLDAAGIDETVVVGHSMGGFVGVVFAHRHPDRVSRLVLVDGGLPFDVPAGVAPADLVPHILGPTADRLTRRFETVAAYIEHWRGHPAFAGEWDDHLREYIAYDLVDDGAGQLRPATSIDVTREDTIDLHTGSALVDALAHLRHQTTFLTTPRGLQNEEPGLYAAPYVERLLERCPELRHQRIDGVNHYGIVMSVEGARAVAPWVR